MLRWLESSGDLEKIAGEHDEYFILVFWGDFSDSAQRAISELEKFGKEYKEVPLFVLDVQKVKGVHKDYGVETVPTLLVLKHGKEVERFEGLESASFYATHLLGRAPTHMTRPARKKTPRVTVYTSPGCPPCGMVKTYLRENGVSFRSIDISRDENAARDVVRRSGQKAVPQIDVNGRLVVGFDRGKLASLLGIGHERERSAS